MNEKTFSIRNAFSFSWEKIKAHWTKLVASFLIFSFLPFLFTFTTSFLLAFAGLSLENTTTTSLIEFISQILSTILSIGFLKILLNVGKDETVTISMIFKQKRYFLRYIGLSLILIFIMILGPVLLAVPGFMLMDTQPVPASISIISGIIALGYFLSRYLFTTFILLDQDTGVMETMKLSSELSKNVKFKLFIFLILNLLLAFSGLILLLVGVLFTIPMAGLALISVYLQLSKSQYVSEG
ncbi:MAG: putative membrane protein [Chlamydiales bacterium]|jgi:uncharacterized membrane protein